MRINKAYATIMSTIFALSLSATAHGAEYALATNLPLTGAWANYGLGMQNSFQLAIDKANASGVLGNIKLRVIAGDDAGSVTQAVSLATQAGADPTVVGAFCCWESEAGIATHSIYQRYKLPVILGGSNDHRSSRPFHSDAVVFRNSPYDLINMKFAAIYAAQIAKFKRIYLIDDNSAFGRTQVDEFAKVVAEKAGKNTLIGRESIAQGEKDFAPLLTRLKSLNPDLIYFGGRIIEASLMRQQMIRLGLKVPLMTSGGTFSETYLKITGDAAEGTLASFWGLPMKTYPGGRGLAFEKAYSDAKFNNPYEAFGPMAYAAGEVYVQAIQAAAKSGGVTRERVLHQLNTQEFHTLIGDFHFDKNGMPSLIHIAIYEVKDGKWQILYRTDPSATKLVKVE
ncbi:MAG: branched-chain amino acid ABC transporter substrate-binding protein [Casimicrobiaceae bacterium]